MRTLNARDLSKSADRLPSDARVIVLHGDNIHVKNDVFRQIRRSLRIEADDPFRLVHLSHEAIDSDPARLADELGAMSMFGGSRLIHVSVLPRQLLDVLDQSAATPAGDWRLVIDVEELDAARQTSTAASKHAIGVACGLEDAGDFHSFVRDEFQRAGVSIDDSVLEFLIPLLGDDRAAARGEVEKLSLLAGTSGAVSLEQVERVVADSSSVISDEIAVSALAGNLSALSTSLDRLQSTGSDAPAALGAASRLLLNLYRGKINQWKSRDGVGQRLSASDARALALVLQNAVLQTRMDSANGPLLAERSLVTLGVAARSRTR